jgi:hypothetical protein
MGIRHMVRRGDSLWRLAGIYLGNGARYQIIVDYHNQEAARFGRHGGLLPIDDPNLIYVGQTVMVPSRQKNPPIGTGRRHEAATTATGLGLKLEYNFEDSKNPLKYKPLVTRDYTITSQMTGKITIENMTHNGFRHNFEIAMAVDKNELSSKLEFGDKALAELTKSVEPQFDMTTGKVTLKASIAAHADIGPYTFEVKADAPNHLTYTFKPEPIRAIVEKGRRRYKYSAEIAFKVDVTLHPSPKEEPNIASRRDAGNESVITVIGIIAAYILILIYGPKGPITRNGGLIPRYAPASNMPFLHQIDPNDPRLKA